MLIQFTNQGFVWESKSGKKEVAPELFGYFQLGGEFLEVIRKGKIVDTAFIQTIGTHASYEGFFGLGDLTNSNYHRVLKPAFFKVGDELRITSIFGDELPEKDYWKGFTLGQTRRLKV